MTYIKAKKEDSFACKIFHVSFYLKKKKQKKRNLQINPAITLITENKTTKTTSTKSNNKFHPSSSYRNRNRSTQGPVAFLQKEGDQEPIRIFKGYQCLGTWLPPFPFRKEPGDLQMGSLNIAHGKQAHPSCPS